MRPLLYRSFREISATWKVTQTRTNPSYWSTDSNGGAMGLTKNYWRASSIYFEELASTSYYENHGHKKTCEYSKAIDGKKK